MRARVHLSSHQRSVVLGHACSMRHAPTRSEEALWRALSGRKLGVLFRRQVPVFGGRYIADFLAEGVRLIVEVDGAWHLRRRAADERRDRALRRAGYHVLRIGAELVERELGERELGAALAQIQHALAALGVTGRGP